MAVTSKYTGDPWLWGLASLARHSQSTPQVPLPDNFPFFVSRDAFQDPGSGETGIQLDGTPDAGVLTLFAAPWHHRSSGCGLRTLAR